MVQDRAQEALEVLEVPSVLVAEAEDAMLETAKVVDILCHTIASLCRLWSCQHHTEGFFARRTSLLGREDAVS